MITDILGREIKVGDFVVFYANVYQVKELDGRTDDILATWVKIILVKKSLTTKPVWKNSKEMCVVPKEDVLASVLKGE